MKNLGMLIFSSWGISVASKVVFHCYTIHEIIWWWFTTKTWFVKFKLVIWVTSNSCRASIIISPQQVWMINPYWFYWYFVKNFVAFASLKVVLPAEVCLDRWEQFCLREMFSYNCQFFRKLVQQWRLFVGWPGR